MAGVIPKKSASGRKQWSLHGSQRHSLNRLRSQLASDGCPESQVVLAKQLLDDECSGDAKSEQKENARLGVYWLIKASEQGNLEATSLLKTCLRTGKGISEHNYMDVKSCISMTQDEKIARRAAKEIFASLSNGSDYITSNQLQRKILAIDRGEAHCSKSNENSHLNHDMSPSHDKGQVISHHLDESSDSESEDTDWSLKSEFNNEKLTEDNVISAAISFAHGHLPAVNNSICLVEPNLRSLDHIPFVYWSILHPLLSLKILYFKLIKFLGSKKLPLHLLRTDIQLVFLLVIYWCVSFDNFAYFLPTVIFYASFIFMIVTTFQMLQTQRELHEFHLWRGLFICYSNGDLNEHSFETQFILKHTKSYAWFFFSLLINYVCYSVTSNLLESEFTVISCCLTFMTLIGFMPKRRGQIVIDGLVLLSFALNVLARYPYDTDPIVSKGWRYLEIQMPSFPSYVVANGIEFCISFRLVLYALIPMVLLKLAQANKWRGSYRTLLPHLVTLSWLQYFALCSQTATAYGLYRAILALVGSVLFLPLVGLTSVAVPVAALTNWIVTSNIIFTVALFFFFFVICLAVCYALAHTRYAQYTAVLQIVLMFLAFWALMKSSEHSAPISDDFEVPVEQKSLNWDNFQKYCHEKIWEQKETTANAQVRCADLENVNVYWEGTVMDIKMLSIENKYKNILDNLPKLISEPLACFFGKEEKVEACDIGDCSVLLKKCSLSVYNTYTFSAKLKMNSLFWSTTPEVYLLLSNEFKNFTERLKPKDTLWFKGNLFNYPQVGTNGILGSFKTNVKVEEIGCISCSDYDLSSEKLYKDNAVGLGSMVRLYDSFKFVLNVMFNPVIIFK